MRLYHNIIFRVSNLLKAIFSCQVLISTSDEENSESILSIDADTLSSCWTTSGSIEMQSRSPTCGRNHRLSLFSRQKLTNRDLGNEESHIFTRTRLLLCLVRQSLTLNDVTLVYGDGYCDAVKTTKIVSSLDFYNSMQRERFTRNGIKLSQLIGREMRCAEISLQKQLNVVVTEGLYWWLLLVFGSGGSGKVKIWPRLGLVYIYIYKTFGFGAL